MEIERKRSGLGLFSPVGVVICATVFIVLGVTRSTRVEPEVTHNSNPYGGGQVDLLGAEAGVSVCRQAENLVLNSSFEDGIGAEHNWEYNRYCSYKTTNMASYSGVTSVYISPNGYKNQECNLFTIIENLGIERNKVYDYAAWVNADIVDGELYVLIRFWGRQGATLKEKGTVVTSSVTDTGGKWVEVTGSAKPPEDAEYARLEVIITAGASEQSYAYVDAAYWGESVCIQLDKVGDPDPVTVGETLTYTIKYENVGRSKSSDVWIRENYDRHVELEWAQPSPDFGDNIWIVPELGPGQDGTISVAVKIDNDPYPPNWVFNTVDVTSHELTEPVRRTVATQVKGQSGNCMIEIVLSKDAQIVQPYNPAIYEVWVLNAGDRDGEVVLTTASSYASSQCDPDHFSLDAGESYLVLLTIRAYAPNPGTNRDITTITATLSCGLHNDQDEKTKTVTTTIDQPSYLPFLAKGHHGSECRTNEWETEAPLGDDNDHFWTADGPLCSARGYYGTPDDDADWFWILLPTDGRISIHVFDHVGEGVQLLLYYQSVQTLVARDVSLTPPYEINYGNAKAGLYYILIYTESGHNWYIPYTLIVQYP